LQYQSLWRAPRSCLRQPPQDLQRKASFGFRSNGGMFCSYVEVNKRLIVLYQLHLKMRAMKVVFADVWQGTMTATSTGRPMDALVCPVAPSAGIPHDFNIYWGYTCVWNILDYPSTVLPIPKFKIGPELDSPNLDYEPITTNPYDKPNHDMCKLREKPLWRR
jgi:hypothetical protein